MLNKAVPAFEWTTMIIIGTHQRHLSIFPRGVLIYVAYCMPKWEINFIICHILEGKRHDATMLGDSRLLQNLEQYAFSTDGQAMCLYGDPAYPLRLHLHAPFRYAMLTAEM